LRGQAKNCYYCAGGGETSGFAHTCRTGDFGKQVQIVTLVSETIIVLTFADFSEKGDAISVVYDVVCKS